MTKILAVLIQILKLIGSLRIQLQHGGVGQGTKLEPEVQTSLVTQPMPKINFEAVNRIIERHQRDPEAIATIVVTNVTRLGIVLRCRYKKQWHLLVNPEDWQRVKASSTPQPLTEDGNMPFAWLAAPPMNAVPVVEDDQLGRQILMAAMTAQEVNQNKARLN